MKPLLLFVHGSAEMYGSDKVLLSLARASLEDERLTPVVVLHERGPLFDALQQAGVEVHVATVTKISRGMSNVRSMLRLPIILTQSSRDLDRICAGRPVGAVYSNTLAVLGGAYWAWRRRLPHVWHVHEIIQQPAIVRRGLPWLAQWLADRTISNSRQTEHWLLQQAPGLKPRSTVIFNGLAPAPVVSRANIAAVRDALLPGSAQAREEPGTGQSVLAVVAGRLNHWKGQGLVVDAMALLRSQGRLGPLKLAIVGDVFAGHEDIRAGLLARVQAAGLQDAVSFSPFVSDILSVWRAADMAVVPSLEPEPFGMVAIEAMACSLPVVAAAHGGLLDIVQDEVTGLLFEPKSVEQLAQALFRLVNDAELRGRLGANGARRQAEEFSLARQLVRTRELCHQLLPV